MSTPLAQKLFACVAEAVAHFHSQGFETVEAHPLTASNRRVMKRGNVAAVITHRGLLDVVADVVFDDIELAAAVDQALAEQAHLRVTRFVAGRTYTGRSICDHNAVYTMTVLSRTAKTIRVQCGHKAAPQTLRPYVYNNVESVMPNGRYSMALTIGADKVQS